MDRVEAMCAAVRNSFPGAELIYTRGGCWSFFVILRTAFPSARPFYDHRIGHVFAEVDGRYYDITGRRSAGRAGLVEMDRTLIAGAHRWAGRSFHHLSGLIALHLRVQVEVSYDASL